MRSEIIVDLSKLDGNLKAIKSRLKLGVKVMAVIKDNAYGHGAVPVARHLCSQVDWFCVATLSEAIELRESGIEIPILVFEVPEKQDADKYLDYRITATIADISTFEILKAGTEYQLNFDTGMRRLGIPDEDFESAVNLYKKYEELRCTGLYTHFSSADEPDNESVTRQLDKFRSVAQHFPDELMKHTANTGAIFYYKDLDLQFDAVRPGVCLYGYLAGESESSDLTPIIEWKSYVMQTRAVKKGESVGYGETWKAPEDGTVGTIPIGYSDGVQRLIGGKIQVEVNGKLVDQVGRISMDYFGIYSPDHAFKTGDNVFIFNDEKLNPKNWAAVLGTIPYEVTTSLHQRIKRIYVKK
ncbi:MAG: alanine racemase [Balneola sp.]|nr:alanine racemase [Balneola sp.]MBO6650376.1 alanine racemase [Balneola sp.]MBO6710227.1 alanine racemase [Balneola sp.]MBO6798912.1 alanine racemase [Balneola sp.]MBO6870026.1 alanine racemase [Balneola sp.]